MCKTPTLLVGNTIDMFTILADITIHIICAYYLDVEVPVEDGPDLAYCEAKVQDLQQLLADVTRKPTASYQMRGKTCQWNKFVAGSSQRRGAERCSVRSLLE